jgi:hypothetical protein
MELSVKFIPGRKTEEGFLILEYGNISKPYPAHSNVEMLDNFKTAKYHFCKFIGVEEPRNYVYDMDENSCLFFD